MADDKTFTQAEVDSIVEGRLARERQKYSDYEDLRVANPKSYPGTKGNKRHVTEHHAEDDAMREFAHQIFGKGE